MSHLRALLLTDVVDSTKVSLRLGDQEMAKLWAAHDRAARDLLPRFRGREIDKTDGLLLLFDAADDAVGYALAYQQALSSVVPELAARVGLHVGAVSLRENSPSDVAMGAKPLELEGLAKATAARVMSVAVGGQILLSEDARRSLNRDDLRLQSHGHWRLKGLDEPIELFEVGDEQTRFCPPPDVEKAYRVVRRDDVWSPMREIRHSLPAERDSFVGRADALDALSRRIRSGVRLVSLLGVGGTGKTRLVTRYARSWLGEFPGGVWFCDLAPARSQEGIVGAVAQGLDIPLGSGDAVAQLGHAIAGRGRCLVILDNFEQVARHSPPTLGRWLERAEQATFVVTTREVLGLPGEDVLTVPPLLQADGIELFMQRAKAARADFRLASQDESAIATLIELLDGLPLAIELAAARVRVMPPRLLMQRMSDRFKLLASKGGRLDRQSTLRATFDWSWDLLPVSEKAALAQLSVFEGGFTLEAAEAVIDVSALDQASWTTDVVHALVDKSFVRPRGDARFDLLVSVQLYAAEHLQTESRYPGSGPEALASAQSRHIAWFAALGPTRAVEDRCADLGNLVTACRRAAMRGDGESAAAALESASRALMLRGPYSAVIALAASVCAISGLADDDAISASLAQARGFVACGQAASAQTLYDKVMTRARAAGNRKAEAAVAAGLAALCYAQSRLDEARLQHQAAISIAKEVGDRLCECSATNGLGAVAFAEGRSQEALGHYEYALRLAREINDRALLGGVLSNLASVFGECGRTAEAQVRLEESLAIARETGNRRLECVTSANLGELHLKEVRLDAALAAATGALVLARELGHVKVEYNVLCTLGQIRERLAHPEEAQRHFEAAVELASAVGDSRSQGRYLSRLGLLHARLGRQEDAKRCLTLAESLLRAASDPVGLGLLLTGSVEAHHLAAHGAAAELCLSEATAIAADLRVEASSELGIALARVRVLTSAR